jgi:steroid 5-alpha reductase family enzyme
MMAWEIYLSGLAVLLALALLGWLASLALRNVNLVDSLWSLFFLAGTITYASLAPEPGPRTSLILALVALWSLRLAVHLAARNWGKPEDRRYRAIRANHSPGFAWKSLYLVFGLQAVLAWGISLPLAAAVFAPAPISALDYVGLGLMLAGLIIETASDRQLGRFKADPAHVGRVLDTGLWRYSRHPNYFGEACVWCGFGLIAVAAGAWWALVSPVLMTFLLLRVSGVALLERDIAERRPAYRDYIARTSAFVPWPPRHGTTTDGKEATR